MTAFSTPFFSSLLKLPCFFLRPRVLVLGLLMISPTSFSEVAEEEAPVVFWISSPVGPDETLMMAGGKFGESPVVEAARLPEDAVREVGELPENLVWRKLTPLQSAEGTLQVVIPKDWDLGVYGIRIDNGRLTGPAILVNAPDAWWLIGDKGEYATPGGTVRVFGRTLNLGGQSQLRLEDGEGAFHLFDAQQADGYSLSSDLPADLAEDTYTVLVHNGHGGEAAWSPAGTLKVQAAPVWKDTVFNVRDIMENYRGRGWAGSATQAVKVAISRAANNGGGVVYFPRGRYRMEETLYIPEHVVIRGEGMDLVSLYWTATEEARESILMGGDSFTIEDLSIYVEGEYGFYGWFGSGLITGYNHVTIQRVRLRANMVHQAEAGQPSKTVTSLSDEDSKGEIGLAGIGILIRGDNLRVTDCDLYHNRDIFRLIGTRHGVIARNQMDAGYSPVQAYGISNLIWEENDYRGSDPWASGIGLSNFHDMGSTHHLYFARNRMQQVYGNDRESMTLDGHGSAYLGAVASVEGSNVVLAEDPEWGTAHKDMLPTWDLQPHRPENAWGWRGISLYVVDGKGAGQLRHITGVEGRTIEIERPWDVRLDDSSLVSIGKYNGRHLFIDNDFEDAGFGIQLYAPCYETIVAGNTMRRSASHNARGHYVESMRQGGMRIEPSWFNQFLDNHIPEGNSWAGMKSEIRVIGYSDAGNEGTWPAARWHVIRNNIFENNGEIRLIGSTADMTIEGNVIKNNDRGILVNSLDDQAADWVRVLSETRTMPTLAILEALDQYRAITHALEEKGLAGTNFAAMFEADSSRAPHSLVIRNNTFENVLFPYIGDSLDEALILPKAPTVWVRMGDSPAADGGE